jgi:FKBP-type peptidyl-prolyl cis-trans isomerase
MHSIAARLTVALIAGLTLTGASACGDDPLAPRDPEDVEFASSLGVDLAQMTRLESGVYIQTLVEGDGVGLQEDGSAEIEYTLWLPDGTEIDDGVIPYPINLIPGFVIGILGAREGETRLIVIPSSLGYGASGQNRIPPHSVLVFRVTMLSVELPVEG